MSKDPGFSFIDESELREARQELRDEIKAAYRDVRGSGWLLARRISAACATRAWLDWGFVTAWDWIQCDLPMMASATFHHLRQAGDFIKTLSHPEAEQWEAVSVWSVTTVLPVLTKNPERAALVLENLQAGATQQDMRRLVAAERPDLHIEAEYRTIKLRVSLSVYEKWRQAVECVAREVDAAEPTDDQIAESLAAAKILEQCE